MDDPPYLKANTMISTCENYIYQNIKMEYIQSKKVRKCHRKSERDEWIIGMNDIHLLDQISASYIRREERI